MKDKIIEKATDLFLRLGFKSITMDDIANEMCISKKTIYKFFINKEVLIAESTAIMHENVHQTMEAIIAQNFNPIQENFEIRKMFKGIFQSAETSPLYQLKKHYPEIYDTVLCKEKDECYRFVKQNMERGMEMGLYRKEIDIDIMTQFYYDLVFGINANTVLEKDAQRLELAALEYHTRAIATPKGVIELERNLSTPNI